MRKNILFAFLLFSKLTFIRAQFSPVSFVFPNAANTNANMDRVGIGNWPFFSLAQPQAPARPRLTQCNDDDFLKGLL